MSPSLERKRVLIVLNYFYPYVSGVSEYARSLAEDLSHSHDVTVLTGQHETSLPEEETIDGYKIVRAPILFRLDKGYVSPAFISRFRVLQAAADYVNLHLPMLESALLTLLSQRPVLLTYQCDMAYEGGIVSKLAVWCVRRSCDIALQRADHVATLSYDYAHSSPFLRDRMDKTTEVWPPNRFKAHATAVFSSLGDKPSEEPHEVFKIGFVGRFVREKGIDVLLSAVELISDIPLKLMLVGDISSVAGGSIYNEISGKVASLGDKVELLGKLNDDALALFYQEIDIIALPSVNRFEAFGMVQVEAMGFGAIPVASDMPGVRATVKTVGIGALAKAGNAEALAMALREAITQRRLHSRRAIAERVLSLQERSVGAVYADLLESL